MSFCINIPYSYSPRFWKILGLLRCVYAYTVFWNSVISSVLWSIIVTAGLEKVPTQNSITHKYGIINIFQFRLQKMKATDSSLALPPILNIGNNPTLLMLEHFSSYSFV